MGFFNRDSKEIFLKFFENMDEVDIGKNSFFSNQISEVARLKEQNKRLESRLDELSGRCQMLINELSALKKQQNPTISAVGVVATGTQRVGGVNGAGEKPAPAAGSHPESMSSVEILKLYYSGFHDKAFDMSRKLNGQNLEQNPMAYFVVECKRGGKTGYFYPNPTNFKSLDFNRDFNLSPVCDFIGGMSPVMANIIEKGQVELRPDNSWKIVKKCKLVDA